jgi:CRISPR-associated protein Cmr6
MGKWYSDGNVINKEAKKGKKGKKGEKSEKGNYSDTLPADWHNPVPIPFLVVNKISLQFCIAPRPSIKIGPEELQEAMKMLIMALEYLGAGAKTATGYGRFEHDTKSTTAQDEIQKQKTSQEEEDVRLDQMTPLEREIDQLIKTANNPAVDLLRLLEKDQWQEETEIIIVANKIKELMESNNEWKPDFSGTNKQKTRLKERSVKVMSYLEKLK